MPLFLAEETLEYPVGDTVFLYERLRYDDLEKVRYLCQVRGQFDQAVYDKVSLAVAIKGWTNLAGKDGLIPYPLRLPASAVSPLDAETLARFAALYPTMAAEEREALHGRVYIVEKLPLDVVFEFLPKIRELEPDLLKKRWNGSLRDGSSLSTRPMAMNSPVGTADASNGDEASPAIPEG